MPKSFTLDGKRYALDPRVPANSIEWIMRRVHVGTPDRDVISDIRRRVAAVLKREPNADWNDRLTEQACRWALKCHRDNLKMYAEVMGHV